MTKVEFNFDYISTNSYIAYKVIPGIEERAGARFTFSPCFLLGIFKLTGNQTPLTAFANVMGKLDYDRLEMRRFADTYNLTEFRINPHFPFSTLFVMRRAIVAQQQGQLREYIDAVYHHVWEDPKKNGRSRYRYCGFERLRNRRAGNRGESTRSRKQSEAL